MVIGQCLPPGSQPSDQAISESRLANFTPLAFERIKWLVHKAQRLIADQANNRVSSAIGNNCENGPGLVHQYRAKCAALLKTLRHTKRNTIDDVSRVSSYGRIPPAIATRLSRARE